MNERASHPTLATQLIRRVNGSWKVIAGSLAAVVVSGAAGYLVLGRQVVTADVDRANRQELRQSIDRNTEAITGVSHRMGSVEAGQRSLEKRQERMEIRIMNEQFEQRRRIDAVLDHLKVPKPE